MRCQQARQLFDAYLDGELSPSQVTELSAHRVKCASCRRELALMEVAGRVLSLSNEPARLSGDFTDRLLACVDDQSQRPLLRFRKYLYVAGPLAAAAVVAFAVFGGFDRTVKSRVAGVKVERVQPAPVSDETWQAIESELREDGLHVEPDGILGGGLEGLMPVDFDASRSSVFDDGTRLDGPPEAESNSSTLELQDDQVLDEIEDL